MSVLKLKLNQLFTSIIMYISVFCQFIIHWVSVIFCYVCHPWHGRQIFCVFILLNVLKSWIIIHLACRRENPDRPRCSLEWTHLIAWFSSHIWVAGEVYWIKLNSLSRMHLNPILFNCKWEGGGGQWVERSPPHNKKLYRSNSSAYIINPMKFH